ncbi:MAG: DNA polymerase I [Candidatus Omnitrophota bacterium]
MQRKTLYLVDGNSYCYRAFYAIGDLRTSDGRPTGAVFGFVNMINKLKNDVRPDYLAICFDLKGPTFRHEKFEAYKAHRKPMPDDLVAQMGIIKEVVTAYGIPIFELDGYEADDVIASLAVKFKKSVDVYIVTGDKDMLQLVDEYVKIYNPQKENTVVDEDKVQELFSVKPSQITDFLALAGDSADNIPGVPGIGKKTAIELIGKFGSLDEILENTDQIPQQKRRELLEEYSEQARLSKDLACVITDVFVADTIDELKTEDIDTNKLREIFRDLEFKNLLKTLFHNNSVNSSPVPLKIIQSAVELSQLCKEFNSVKEYSFYVSVNEENNKAIDFIDISRDLKNIYRIIPGNSLGFEVIKKELAPVLSNPDILKISYDVKSAGVALADKGLFLEEPFFDIMVAAYLLQPSEGTLKIEDIAQAYLDKNIYTDTRAAEQMQLKKKLLHELKEKELEKLFSKVEMPLVRVLSSMQQVGICVDRKLLISTGKQLDKKLNELIQKIYKISGCEFNINSTKQLREVLFDQLKLPVIKKGKTGPSTDAEVLMRLSAQHALPQSILEYRELAKLKSTYVDGMLGLIDQQTNRLHTSFNQAVTATGRLSSSAPNLQNIPVRTEAGKKIRAIFVSRDKNWQLLSADYSQIELRVLAHLSKDKNLTKAFHEDRDIHDFTASLIFAVEEEAVTKKMRDVAKRVNFGIVYGMGSFGLARDIGVSVGEAKQFIEGYFARYPAVGTYMQQQIEQAKESGYVKTLLNRRRYIPQIKARDQMQRSFAERTAMNTPIQGTAADLIKVAMVEIYRIFAKEKLKAAMVLQVHDELVFDVPDTEMNKVRKIVKDVMENVLKLDVPIKVSLKIGSNWKDMK